MDLVDERRLSRNKRKLIFRKSPMNILNESRIKFKFNGDQLRRIRASGVVEITCDSTNFIARFQLKVAAQVPPLNFSLRLHFKKFCEILHLQTLINNHQSYNY